MKAERVRVLQIVLISQHRYITEKAEAHGAI